MAEPHSSIDIKIKRVDRVFRVDEMVEGTIVVNAYKGWSHNGITMVAEGIIYLSSQSRGIIGLGYNYRLFSLIL